MTNVLKGRVVRCAKSGKVHFEQEQVATFQFADYSWDCKACGGRHCSNCEYETDGNVIVVYDCGRFG